MRRRFFLGGVLALSVAPVAAKVALATDFFAPTSSLPIIKGDGLWDDAPGLQALLDGEPFEVASEDFKAEEGLIRHGAFRISKGLVVRRGTIELRGNRFKADFNIGTEAYLRFTSSEASSAIYYNSCMFPGGEEIVTDQWHGAKA